MNERGENSYPTGQIPAPGGEVHPSQFIETKVLIKDGKIVEGSEKVRDIRDKYKKSPENPPETGKEDKLTLDKERLNRIIKGCAVPGALFGRDVTIDETDIAEIGKVVSWFDATLKRAKAQDQPKWDEFMHRMSDLKKEGRVFLLAGDIVDDGASDQVAWRLRQIEGQGGKKVDIHQIGLPTPIYNLYQWTKILDSTKDDMRRAVSPHGLGTTANSMAENLSKLARFLRDNKKI